MDELALALEAHRGITPPADLRSPISNGVFNASKRKRLADRATCTKLELRRLHWHGGLTREELGSRSTVAERVIAAAEAGESISDHSWQRLATALALPGESPFAVRKVIDPTWVSA